MFFRNITITLLLSVLLACSSSNAEDNLIGTFSFDSNGQMKEMYRVEKDGENYILFDKNNYSQIWKKVETPLIVITKEEFLKATKMEALDSFAGLRKGKQLLIYKTDKGFKLGGFTSKTGYFAFYAGSFLELHKK